MTDRDLGRLEALIGYGFSDRELLTTALTHRSYANEHRERSLQDNEKLEFLGDAVLGLVVGHMLMVAYPELHEGDLSVTRAQVVSENGLNQAATELGLGEWLYLGRGEERTGGREKPSLCADALEALVAAVYLDGGFAAARTLIERLFTDRIEHIDPAKGLDFKTRLQERAQADLRATPEYRVISSRGPDHDKTFEVEVVIHGRVLARAAGKSKKAAEQRAAAKAAKQLDSCGPEPYSPSLSEEETGRG